MKKMTIIILLMISAINLSANDIVGNMTYIEPGLEISIDFYNDPVGIDEVLEIITVQLISTQAQALWMTDEELSDYLYDLLGDIVFDFSNISSTWGDVTINMAVTYTIHIYGRLFLVVNLLPEDRYWFFEFEM